MSFRLVRNTWRYTCDWLTDWLIEWLFACLLFVYLFVCLLIYSFIYLSIHLSNYLLIQARIQKCGLGGSSAEGSGGSGEGAVPPPQKNFGIFSFEMVHFDAFWSTF